MQVGSGPCAIITRSATRPVVVRLIKRSAMVFTACTQAGSQRTARTHVGNRFNSLLGPLGHQPLAYVCPMRACTVWRSMVMCGVQAGLAAIIPAT